jgi:hypothetical protein
VKPVRLPLLLVAFASLLLGMWGGLLRMSWALPLPTEHANWLTYHGPLMVVGFFGTLIGIERALALGRLLGWAAPALSAASAVVVAVGALGPVAPALAVAGAAGLLGMTVLLGRRRPGEATRVMALGAVAGVAGNALWLLGHPIPRAVVPWAAFFALTIAGERLELARLRPATRFSASLFRGAIALLLAGALLAPWRAVAGERVAALGLLLLAGWLLRYDIALVTVRAPGLPRFSAVALLSAYAWLALGAVLLAAAAPLASGLPYDAAVHAIFLGFVFGMVFGHAPIVLGAVLGRPARFHPAYYAPLALLDLSLLLRVGADHAAWHAGRRWGGMLGSIAVVAFLALVAAAALTTRAGVREAGARS